MIIHIFSVSSTDLIRRKKSDKACSKFQPGLRWLSPPRQKAKQNNKHLDKAVLTAALLPSGIGFMLLRKWTRLSLWERGWKPSEFSKGRKTRQCLCQETTCHSVGDRAASPGRQLQKLPRLTKKEMKVSLLHTTRDQGRESQWQEEGTQRTSLSDVQGYREGPPRTAGFCPHCEHAKDERSK